MTEREASEPLDALLEAAVDAIVIADKQGRILRFNSAAERMFGYVASEVLGQNIQVLMPEPDRGLHDGYLRSYLSGGPARIIGRGREVTARHADGARFPIHLSVGEIAGQGTASFVGIIRDLTQEKAAQDTVRDLEQQLTHADRLVVLGELTAGIAHEINQPLTAIAAFADAGVNLLRGDAVEAGASVEEICQRIAEQARRAADVIARLRDLTRRGEVTKSPQDINALLSNVLRLMEHELALGGVRVDVDIDDQLAEVVVDDIQIQQVLVNLIKNSIDALVDNGVAEPVIRVSTARRDDMLCLTVSDNGPGVPEALRDRLFDSFFTTKPRGVGLGLAICRNIAVAHGGQLRYAPAPGGGAEFQLSLPLEMIG